MRQDIHEIESRYIFMTFIFINKPQYFIIRTNMYEPDKHEQNEQDHEDHYHSEFISVNTAIVANSVQL